MTRLTLALATVALLAAAPVALAQAAAGGPGRGGAMMMQARMMTALFQDIALTADQQAQVEAVTDGFQPRLDSARAEMMAARQGGTPVAPERVQAMRALQAEQRAALRAVLTPEQQAQFDRNVAAMPQGRAAGRGGRPPRA